MGISKKKVDIFDEYFENDSYVYLPISINNSTKMIEEMFDFFFSEETLLKHFCVIDGNKTLVRNIENYSLIYRNLLKFIDSEIKCLNYNFEGCSTEIIKIVKDEETYFASFSIRRDKVGKIGEYLMSIILECIFKFDCVVRKSDFITSYNMSVYGIDTIHFNKENNTILFGESKFTCSLSNGINLINESLSHYEKRINDEIELVFSPSNLDKLNLPKEKYKKPIECFLDVKTFIKETNTNTIGVPLFIAHGQETNPKIILNEMRSINKKSFLGLKTKYYVISMPINDIQFFIKGITLLLKNKLEEYKNTIKEQKDEH